MRKFDFEKLSVQVGGTFRFTSLVQKRLRELVQGSPRMVDVEEGTSLLDVVYQEISEGKISLKQDDPKPVVAVEETKPQ